MDGGKYKLLHVDKKGRVHIPLNVRSELGITGEVLVESKEDSLVLHSVRRIDDPLAFLSSFNLRTKKTPVEMKREAEQVFSHEAVR